ncbi:hypothetical protein PITC_082770 [Penicillium italicum]|uniref:Uncharacterized protein n=1 Tax=Penicillium italicum TaxID=40296 RepID=A0A0A2L674_PENIT|nr:hypothetical protein PITC_082770 [Penicillium italicum]
MIGYDFEHYDEFGLCLAAARQLSAALEDINVGDSNHQYVGLNCSRMLHSISSKRGISALSQRDLMAGFTSAAKQKCWKMEK